MPNVNSVQEGIEKRNRIVELVNENVDNGGDGMTRTELAAALGIGKPTLIKHMWALFEDGRIEQIGKKVLPIKTGHIHVCRTCGKTMHFTEGD